MDCQTYVDMEEEKLKDNQVRQQARPKRNNYYAMITRNHTIRIIIRQGEEDQCLEESLAQ